MGEKWLELKVMYCKDLKLFNFFQKLNVYALVSLVTDDNQGGGEDKNENEKPKLKKKQEQRTPTDTEGDANPEWNHEMRFDLDDFEDDKDRLFLHFDLRSEANGILALGGDRCIGQVWVPLKDVVEPNNNIIIGGGGIARFVNYEVRTLDGKSNGVINFSFKPNFKQQHSSSLPNLPTINIHGYPIHHHHNIHEAQDQNLSSPTILYPPSPSSLLSSSSSSSGIHYPSSINMEFNETNSPHFYYDAVSSPVTPYSPQQGHYQYHHHPHHFSPLRPPPPPVAYPPPQFLPPPPPQQQQQQQPVPYAYIPPPPPQHHDYQVSSSPNWAQYPRPPDPLYGVANGGDGGYDYFHGPGSPGTPIGSETTAWPLHFRPGGDHFSPSWNSR